MYISNIYICIYIHIYIYSFKQSTNFKNNIYIYIYIQTYIYIYMRSIRMDIYVHVNKSTWKHYYYSPQGDSHKMRFGSPNWNIVITYFWSLQKIDSFSITLECRNSIHIKPLGFYNLSITCSVFKTYIKPNHRCKQTMANECTT